MKFLESFLSSSKADKSAENKDDEVENNITPSPVHQDRNTAQETATFSAETTSASSVAPTRSSAGPLSEDERQTVKMRAIDILQEIYDPEIPVNIYELGLIYAVDVDDDANVDITMTLTTPHCPVAETMPGEVEMRVRDAAGVNDVKVNLVWSPPWDMTMMSKAARLEMGFM